MRNTVVVLALVATVLGCSEPRDPVAELAAEAKAFGYKGSDLAGAGDRMFFSTGVGVTNWLPSRVLAVYEKYDFTADELRLVEDSGEISPSSSFETIPAGFSKKTEEPWFTTWCKEAERFGIKGMCGFVSHYDSERAVWVAGETYFSSYYDAKEPALATLAAMREKILGYNPKKIYDFPDCFVAEYVRLRVMCLVGQRPDGTWTCMLDLQDKVDCGCGQWEPVESQEEMLADDNFRKAVKRWNLEVAEFSRANHAEVERRRLERAVPLFGDAVHPAETGDGRMYYVRGGVFAMSNTVAAAVWQEKYDAIVKATGLAIPNVPFVASNGSYAVWSSGFTNDIYEVRLDMAFPQGEGADGQNGEWRELCIEQYIGGRLPPPRPTRQ